MSIKKSLQSSILFLAVIPVILMALLAYFVSLSKYASINEVNTTKIASDYSYGLVSQLESQIIETEALASTNSIKSYLLEKVNSPDALVDKSSVEYQSIKESIIQLSNNADHSVNYYFYDIDGYLTITTDSDSNSDWAEVMDKPISEFTNTTILPKSNFNQETLDIIAPVTVKDQIVGLLRTNISREYFGIFLSEERGTFLLDNEGNPMFGYPLDEGDGPFYDYIKEVIASFSDKAVMDDVNDAYSENTEYLYGYATIPLYDWIYVVKQDTSGYTNIVSSLPLILIVLLVIVIIFSSVISNGLAHSYTKPIFELQEDIREAAAGKLDVHCDVDTDDEFGDLANNFNQMMDIIFANYKEISASHKKLEENQIELKDNYLNIKRIAYTDALTGLYNRMAFFKFADDILTSPGSSKQRHAVIFIDLDGFKSINDTLGHDYGDLLLQAVTADLSERVAADDILARNGGDEFVILRNSTGTDKDLQNFMASLVNIASHPFVLGDETVRVTISAGVAVYPQNGTTLTDLMKKADIAMYSSKNSGKNSYTFFNLDMENEVRRRNDLIEILRESVEMHDVHLVYQPQFNSKNHEIIGAEALMRLDSIELGTVTPDEFIPVAEESGLIDELGEWALIEACSFNHRIIEAGFKPLNISVNISTAQLRGDKLLNIVKSIPQRTAMPLEYLEIELTENVLLKNFEHNLEIINKLKGFGVRIALDDFGTGYSSFNYLTKIPIDTLKIDRSFVAKINNNEKDAYIADTIINLAHKLGITVIAEGVENIEQLNLLKEETCDILQGYFFSKALNEEEFFAMLNEK
ncbi:MAG: EAL domain-containing protein [Lachnospiraceae bacterium]|nr:EAL domain-containing protein [Lachnospiraceae bacterium]